MPNKKKIDLDDFIHENIKVEKSPNKKTAKATKTKESSSTKINPKAKLMDFAKIKVVAIDPRLSKQVENLSTRITDNLEKLRKLWN